MSPPANPEERTDPATTPRRPHPGLALLCVALAFLGVREVQRRERRAAGRQEALGACRVIQGELGVALARWRRAGNPLPGPLEPVPVGALVAAGVLPRPVYDPGFDDAGQRHYLSGPEGQVLCTRHGARAWAGGDLAVRPRALLASLGAGAGPLWDGAAEDGRSDNPPVEGGDPQLFRGPYELALALLVAPAMGLALAWLLARRGGGA